MKINLRAVAFVVAWIGLLTVVIMAAGCATKDEINPPVTLVIPEQSTAKAPDECSPARDPKWKNLSDDDAKRADAARNYKENKQLFRSIEGKRRVCGDALKSRGML